MKQTEITESLIIKITDNKIIEGLISNHPSDESEFQRMSNALFSYSDQNFKNESSNSVSDIQPLQSSNVGHSNIS